MLYRRVKNYLRSKSSLFFNIINKICFLLNNVIVGNGIKTYGKIFVLNYEGSIKIGNNVTINSAPWANPIGFGYKTQIQTVGNSQLIIGDNVGLSNCAITCAKKIIIGNNTLIGSGVKIYDTDFHPVDPFARTQNNTMKIKVEEIIIGDNVFIGAGSTILKGVRIGSNSVIGAGSVVTKNVPDNEIWAGNPAIKVASFYKLEVSNEISQ